MYSWGISQYDTEYSLQPNVFNDLGEEKASEEKASFF